jgi:hypothetical protein
MSVDPIAFDKYINENCPHCHAEWGHFISCPLLNRTTAEAFSVLFSSPGCDVTEEDSIRAHAMGIKL